MEEMHRGMGRGILSFLMLANLEFSASLLMEFLWRRHHDHFNPSPLWENECVPRVLCKIPVPLEQRLYYHPGISKGFEGAHCQEQIPKTKY